MEICLHQSLMTYIKDKWKGADEEGMRWTIGHSQSEYIFWLYTAGIILLCLYISHFTCQNFIRTIFLWYFKHSKTLQKIWNLAEELSNIRQHKGWDSYLGNWRGVVCWRCFGCQENPTKGICASTSVADYLLNFGQITSSIGELSFSLPCSRCFTSRCLL